MDVNEIVLTEVELEEIRVQAYEQIDTIYTVDTFEIENSSFQTIKDKVDELIEGSDYLAYSNMNVECFTGLNKVYCKIGYYITGDLDATFDILCSKALEKKKLEYLTYLKVQEEFESKVWK